MSKLILASASPRRKQLLSEAGFLFEIEPSSADETLPKGIEPEEAVQLLAKKKCFSVLESHPDAVVLGCDTVVVLDGKIIGKPRDRHEAEFMLGALSGRTHTVYTGVCIANSNAHTAFFSSAKVKFYPLSKQLIQSYIATGDPMDKAGAYGIQGIGAALVQSIDGDFYTVMGMPLAKVERTLAMYHIYGKLSF